jgi:hypothetical protein
MSASWFHLAQVNVARAVAPLADPRLADFIANIARVNAAAEQAPGFVWRYLDDEESPSIGDSTLLFNLSVWEAPEALEDYVRGGAHLPIMRRRAEWFKRPDAPSLALWWLPAGDHPRPSEAMARLDFLARHGPTEAAFTFREPFPAPPAPEAEPVAGAVSYDGRRFAPVRNSANGDVDSATIFEYRQRGGRVRARYSGAGILFGSLVAASDARGALDVRYRHFTPEGNLRAGLCRSTPENLPGGRLRIHEDWQWTVADRSAGQSLLEELS